jgi:uncharacterized protein
MFLDLHLTERCNLRCFYCYFKKINKKECNEERLLKTLEYFLSRNLNKVVYLTFIGGEPTLKFGLIEKAVTWGKKIAQRNGKKIYFNLVTNGTNLDEKKIYFLKKNSFYVVLSFDGEKETQDYQRPFPGGKSSFKVVESTLENLIKQNITFSIRMTVTPYSAGKLFENVKYFWSKKVNVLGIVPTYEAKWTNNDLNVFEENFRKLIKVWIENLRSLKEFCILPFITYLKTWKNGNFFFHPYMHYCQVGSGVRYSVSATGDIYPCHRFTSIKNKQFKLGNILEGGINLRKEKIFNEKITKIKKENEMWGCFALNYEVNKDIKKPLHNYQQFKNIFLRLISEIYQNSTSQYKSFLKWIKNFPY